MAGLICSKRYIGESRQIPSCWSYGAEIRQKPWGMRNQGQDNGEKSWISKTRQ